MKKDEKDELIKLIDTRIDARLAELNQDTQRPKFVYGLTGLSILLNVSRHTALKLIATGKIPVLGTPKKMMFPIDGVLEALGRDPATEFLTTVKNGGQHGK
jgi:hypothetical protein